MPKQITIVWNVTSRFSEHNLTKVLITFKAQQKSSRSEHVLGIWKVNGLTIKYYKRKIVVQGNLNDYNKTLLLEITKIEGLTLDDKNAAKLRQIFPSKQNAIVCDECKSTSLLIEAKTRGLDVVFVKECGHEDRLITPLTMINSRILPDLNVLISQSISRLVKLGYFNGFEVTIPEFMFDVIDQFKGKGNKDKVSQELMNLRRLEQDNKIKIISLKTDLINLNELNLPRDEDKVILKIANLTNSVLVTGDQVLKDRAILENRPTIYIPAKIFGELKIIEEVRNPCYTP